MSRRNNARFWLGTSVIFVNENENENGEKRENNARDCNPSPSPPPYRATGEAIANKPTRHP